MSRWKKFWKTPFPDFQSKQEKIIFGLTIGLFIFAFLLFFQPFGVNNYDPRERITWLLVRMTFLFGMEISSTILLNEFLIKPWIIKKHTIGTTVTWTIWNLFSIGTVVFLTYNFIGNWHDMSWSSYLEFLLNVSAVAIFPIGIFFIFSYLKNQNHSDSHLKKNKIDYLIFVSDNQKDRLLIDPTLLLYIESQDNYSAIFFLRERKVAKKLIRSTLKRLEKNNLYPGLIRCHRSYLVNLNQIKHYEGNKHGVQLSLHHTEKTIPVSRKFVDKVLSSLEPTT